jgi:hypothetical protein
MGRSCNLKAWKHEIDAVCVCGDREKAKTGVHLSVGAVQGIRRGSRERLRVDRCPYMSSFPWNTGPIGEIIERIL